MPFAVSISHHHSSFGGLINVKKQLSPSVLPAMPSSPAPRAPTFGQIRMRLSQGVLAQECDEEFPSCPAAGSLCPSFEQ